MDARMSTGRLGSASRTYFFRLSVARHYHISVATRLFEIGSHCAILDVRVTYMAAKLDPILTIADLDAMPDDGNRYEIIEGELFVSCAPSLSHQDAVGNAFFALKEYLRDKPIGAVWAGAGVILSNFSGVIPDIAYVSNERLKSIADGDRITGPPDIVIEVLSPGIDNERRDKQAKRQLFRKHGVKEYWIVDPSRRTIEIYGTARLKLVRTLHLKDFITSPLLPGFRCPVKNILA
jgi:Uma2 family endonuclease